jgi:hypothetical protein
MAANSLLPDKVTKGRGYCQEKLIVLGIFNHFEWAQMPISPTIMITIRRYWGVTSEVLARVV